MTQSLCKSLRPCLPLLLGLLLLPFMALARPPAIAAASDLQYALEDVARAFTAETGEQLRMIYGSSGLFATQIRNGAPFELYLSADEAYVQELHADGFTRDEGSLYALGRIALMAPEGSTLRVDPNLSGLAAALEAGEIRRFAIANPAHAPYGRRAEEALRSAGLWQAIEPHLVLGENVSQAAQFATGGSSQGGIIALSLALSPQLADVGRHALIPEDWHSPLRQRMVLLKDAGPVARQFYDFLQSPAARAIMQRYGFSLPATQTGH